MPKKQMAVREWVHWVKLENFGELQCLRCKTTLSMKLPWNVRDVIVAALFFEEWHRECRA